MFFKKKSKSLLNRKTSLELVKSLIYDAFDGELTSVLTLDTTLEEIGFDSIKFINLMLSLEDVINADLEVIAADIDVASINTINDLVIIVDKYTKN